MDFTGIFNAIMSAFNADKLGEASANAVPDKIEKKVIFADAGEKMEVLRTGNSPRVMNLNEYRVLQKEGAIQTKEATSPGRIDETRDEKNGRKATDRLRVELSEKQLKVTQGQRSLPNNSGYKGGANKVDTLAPTALASVPVPVKKRALSGLEKKLNEVRKNNPKWGVKTPRKLPTKIKPKKQNNNSSWGARDLKLDEGRSQGISFSWKYGLRITETDASFISGTIRSRNATKEEYDEQAHQVESAVKKLQKISVVQGETLIATVKHGDRTTTSVKKDSKGKITIDGMDYHQQKEEKRRGQEIDVKNKDGGRNGGGGRGMGG